MPENTVIKALDRYRLKNRGVPIIVEGKNDAECLRKLDFRGEVIILNSGDSIVNFCDTLAENYREVILLTDFDRKGVELRKKIQRYLSGLGCQVDAELWKNLRRYANIRTIEELPFAVERILQADEEKIRRKEISYEKWNLAKQRK